MTVPAFAVYAAVVGLRPCWAERADPRQSAHLERIAVAVSLEALDMDDAAGLVAIAKSESGFSVRVQAGATGSGALSDWQLEGQSRRYRGPFVGLELEPIRNAAHAAASIWRSSFQCGRSLRDRFTAYAGRPCGTPWPTLETRVRNFWYARAVMTQELAAQ